MTPTPPINRREDRRQQLVDAVSDILTVTDDMIQPTPDVASEMVRMFVRGLLAIEGRMVSFISLDRVLPDNELDHAA